MASPGRPRKRSIEESLDIALELFWRQGYEGTSIQDLSEALGVGPSSLYNSFGSKSQLYLKCLERYTEQNVELQRTLTNEHALTALHELIDASVVQYTKSCSQPGCALLSAPRQCDPELSQIDDFCVSRRAATMDAIEHTIVRAIQQGDLRTETNASSLARFIMSTLQGMSSQAEDGASRIELEQVAKHLKAALATYAAREDKKKKKMA